MTCNSKCLLLTVSAVIVALGFAPVSIYAQGALQITSPANGVVVHPGDAITVTVSASGDTFASVSIIGTSPLPFTDAVMTPPFQFTMFIPEQITPGIYNLTAIGSVTSGQPITSLPVTLDVERPDAPVSVSVDTPGPLELSLGDVTVVHVSGTFADGSNIDLTKSSGTTFVSGSPNTVSVLSNGVLSAIAPGATQIIVDGTITIPVTVDEPVILEPGTMTLTASQDVQFSARLTTNPSDKSVTWSLNPSGLGTIDASGTYTAPSSISSQQTVVVTATSVADNTQAASATITLSPAASITLSPGWAVVYPAQTQPVTATTSNVANITWSLTPTGLGSISNTGIYTAPSTVQSLQQVTVTATSTANPAITATSTLWVSPQPFLITLNAPSVVVPQGGSGTLMMNELAADNFPHPVVFSVTGFPSGVTGSFTPPTVTGTGGTTLMVTASPSAAPGSYSVTITATDTIAPNLVQSQSVPLFINSSQAPAGFVLGTSAGTLTVLPGDMTTINISETPSGQFSDVVSLSIGGLPTGVTASFNPTSLSAAGSAALNLAIGPNVTNGAYSLTITGTDLATGANQSVSIVLVILPSSPGAGALPSGWTNQDVGAPTASGTTTFNNNAFQLQGSGSGSLLSSTTDQFQYAFTGVQGDGTVVARVVGIENSNSQAGIMIRDSLDPNSPYVSLCVNNGLVYFLNRSTYASVPSVLATIPINGQFPFWFQLSRQGNSFTASTSTDGVNWTQMTDVWGNWITASVSMSTNVLAGLMNTASADGSSNTAAFDNVAVTSPASGWWLSGSPTTVAAQQSGTASSMVTSIGTPGFSDSVNLSISGLPTGTTASFGSTSVTGSASTPLTLSIGSSTPPGAYSLTISGTDSLAATTLTTTIALIVLPSTPLSAGGLPAGWTNLDIGQPAVAGQSAFSNGTFQLQGSGGGIFEPDTSDQLQFAFTALQGDGSVSARLLSIQQSDSDAGIMIRNSLDPSDTYVMISVSGGTVYFMTRSSYGAPTIQTATGPDVQLPIWVQLVRQGSNFSPSFSVDGTNWVPMTDDSGNPITFSVSMNANVEAGVFGSAGYDGSSNLITFDNVSVAAASSGFSVSTSAATLQISPNSSAAATITTLGTPGFNDVVNLSATGLPTGITASFNNTSLTGSASTALTLSVSATASLGTFPITITATDATAGTSETTTINLLILPATLPGAGSLPAGWSNQDVGQVAVAGQTAFSNGVFQLQGSGSGVVVPATSDQFQYAFTGLQGDGSIVGRIVSTQDETGQVGLMIRDSLDPTAAYAMLSVNQGMVSFLTRYPDGSAAYLVAQASTTIQLPIWLKLVQQSGVVSPFISSDGTNWTQLTAQWGPAEAWMPSSGTAYVGLIDSALNNGPGNIAAFDNVSVNTSTSGFSLSNAPAIVQAQPGTTATATITSLGTPGFGDTVNLSISGLPSGVTAAWSASTLTGTGSATLTLTVGSSVPAGDYALTITGTDATTASTQSTVVTLVVQFSGSGATGALPAGWTSEDVGQPSVAGQSAYAGGVFQLEGSGDGIFEPDTSDQLQFAFTGLQGDGSITARVLSVQQSDSDAGVMIRNSLDPSSSYVMASVSGGTVYVMSRTPDGAPTYQVSSGLGNEQVPVWLQLVRQGDQFMVLISSDGVNWAQLWDDYGNPISIWAPMNTNVLAGLFSTAGYDGTANAATFDNVTVNSTSSGFSLATSATAAQVQPGNAANVIVTTVGTPGFNDTINLSISGLPTGVTAAFSNSSLTGSGTSSLSVTVSAGAAAGTYLLTVTGTDSVTSTIQTAVVSLTVLPIGTVSAGGLPAGWTNEDVGQPAVSGQTGFSGGVFQLQSTGTGALAAATNDQFQYAFTGLQGDGTVVARVISSQSSTSQVGVMIRNTLDPNSAYVSLYITAGTLYFVYRDLQGDQTALVTSGPSGSLPLWLQLARQGNTFIAYTSTDGVNWNQLYASNWWDPSTASVSMNSAVYAGLFDTAAQDGSANLALFDNASVTSANSGFALSLLPATAQAQAGGTANATVTVAGTPAFPDTVNLSISGLPTGITATFGASSVTGSGTSTLALAVGSSVPVGDYPLTVTATDATTGTTQTAALSLVVLPSTPAGFSGALPTGWSNQDVGQPSVAGQSAYSGGVFQLTSSGTGALLSGTTDQFQYAFTGLQGDGSITARLLATQSATSQAGVMIRNSLDPTDAYVMLYVSSGTAYFVNRSAQGAATTLLGSADNLTSPVWLQLSRQGNSFTAATSADGSNWIPISDTYGNLISASVTLNANVYIGLLDTAAFDGSQNVASFDNVTVTSSGTGFSISGSPSTVQAQLNSTATATVTSLCTPGFSDTVNLSVSGLPTGVTGTFNVSSLTGAANSTLTLTINSSAALGIYPVTITGTDATTGTTQSTTITVILVPPAPGAGSSTLPSGWSNQDIGTVATPGQSGFANSAFELVGSGYGIVNGASVDGLQYAFTGLQGDGNIVARLVSTQTSNSQAGVTIRSSLDPSDTYASAYVSGTTLYFFSRSSYGGQSLSVGSTGVQLPVWIELIRQGNSFSVSTSSDGTNWNPLTDYSGNPLNATVSMNASVYVGLTDSMSNNIGQNTAVFDNVAVTSSSSGFAMIASPSNLFTSPGATATTQITSLGTSGFADAVNLSISGLPAGVTGTFTASSLTGTSATTLSLSASSSATVGNYQLTVTGTDAATGTTQTASIALFILPGTTLPAGGLPNGWANTDVGQPAVAGQSAYQNGVFQLEGSGYGLVTANNTSDQFQYAFTGLEGDGSIVARLLTSQTVGSAQGIMIRNSLDPSSVYAALYIQNNEVEFIGRSGYGVASNYIYNGPINVTLPLWLKLTRQGSSISVYLSPDGSNWTQLGSGTSMPLNSSAYIGLMDAAGDNGALIAQTFDNVTVTSASSGFTVSTSATAIQTQPGASAVVTATSLGTPGFSDSVTFSVSGAPTDVSASLSPLSVSGSGNSVLTITIASNASEGTYPLTITGTDATTGISQTAIVSLLVLPATASQGNLPAGWTNQEIGDVIASGASTNGKSTFSGGVFELQDSESGTLSLYNIDAFQYAFTAMEGDGSIVARVISTQNSAVEAGIMIRNSLSNDTSAYVALYEQNGNISFFGRTADGAQASLISSGPANLSPPIWLKLVRQTNTFTPYTSADGTNWNQVTDSSGNPLSISIPLNTNVYAGLMNDAPANGVWASAIFDNVAVTSAASGFTLTASTPIVQMSQSTATVTISSSATSGFNDRINLSLSTLPTGLSATFSTSSLTGSANTTLTLSKASNVSPGSYTVTVTGVDSTTAASQSVAISVVIPPAYGSQGGLPAGWTNQDVGQPPTPGETAYSNGLWEVEGKAGGLYISQTSDQFQYAFTGLEGDGAIVARLLATDVWDAQNGVMIRESLDPSSMFVMLYLYEGNVYLSARSSFGAGTYLAASGPANVQFPIWLKLMRTGNSVTSYTSPDGTNWTQLTDSSGNLVSISAPISSNAYIGLLDTTTEWSEYQSRASFDQVSVTSVQSGFSLAIAPGTLQAQLNSTSGTQVTVLGTSGFSDVVNLSTSTLPNGVSASFNNNSVTGSGGATLTFSISSSASPGSYSVTVTGSDSNTSVTQTAAISLIILPSGTLTSGGLPSGWTNQDIGQPGAAGQSAFSNGLFQVQGSGSDIWSIPDQFQYAFTALEGDGTVVARLLNAQVSASNSKPGIMIRNTLDPASAHVFLEAEGGANARFISRTSDGGDTSEIGTVSGSLPQWFKLVRQSNTFTAYSSPDGVNWTQVGTVTASMGTNVFAGLAVSAADDGSLTTADFDNVTISSSGTGFFISSFPTTLQSASSGTVSASITSVGTPGFADVVNLSTTGLPNGIIPSFSANSITGSGSSTLTLSLDGSVADGTYTFTVTGTDATTSATQSATITLTVQSS